MSQMLLNMAKQAVHDTSLMASLIDQYVQDRQLTWAEMAPKLNITPAQLGKLALCRQPNGSPHQEINKIADYVKMDTVVLNHFFQEAQHPNESLSKPSNYQPGKLQYSQTGRHMQTSHPSTRFMSRKYFWAAGLVLLLLLIGGAFVVAQPTAVSEATLVIQEGEAIISRADTDKTYTAVSGEAVVVTAGDTVTTDAKSTAQLHLENGGTVDIFEATTLEITELVTTEEKYQVTLTMLTGRTLNRVVHLLGIDDHYEVRSPSSTASVRGTVFMVDVLSPKSTHVVVDEGIVNVAMGDQNVDVMAGFEVTAVVGELLIVKPQEQPPVPQPSPTATRAAPTPTPTVEPTEVPPEPTATPTPVIEAKHKSSGKLQESDLDESGPLISGMEPKIDPEQPEGSADNPKSGSATDSSSSNGGNPHEGMTVPGNTPDNGTSPTGGAEAPGQGGTPPGQTDNPGQGNDNNNSGGNSSNNGNSSSNNGGGKKDK